MTNISFLIHLAFEYEKLQCEKEFLEDFFQSSAKKVQTEIVQKWLQQLIQCRSSGKQLQFPSDSNLHTILKHILYDDQGLNRIFSPINLLFVFNRNIFI